MKLLGVEFSDFACFDRQFVPIRPGVNLLVGKNNAGKTALLRGLGALVGIPVGNDSQQLSPPAELAGYIRRPQKEAFVLEVLYRIEDTDRYYIDGAPEEWWAQVLQRGTARWKFAAHPNVNILQFLECRLDFPPTQSGITTGVALNTEAANAGYGPLKYPEMTRLRHGALGEQIPHSSLLLWSFGKGTTQTVPLEQLRNVRLTRPHRAALEYQNMATQRVLREDGSNLAPFLQTLQGLDRPTFDVIERLLIKVFPEFKRIDPTPGENNVVTIQFTRSQGGQRVTLANCGTGVEQILCLAAFVATTTKPGIILLDEPHSYLHPYAERALVQFLSEHPEHYYVISTHSAVLMNSVDADRITNISPPGQPFKETPDAPRTAPILRDLGYRNSDALFADRLIIVEGDSDSVILPILLGKSVGVPEFDLSTTQFPFLGGVGDGAKVLQTAILRYEQLLCSLGRSDMPRIYVFDGDKKPEDENLLKGTKNLATGEHIKSAFLPRLELENYLLVPEAVSEAINEELEFQGEAQRCTKDEISSSIAKHLESDDAKLFPKGKEGDDPAKKVKASTLLSRIYDTYSLRYHKEQSGRLIAQHMTKENQRLLQELVALVWSPILL